MLLLLARLLRLAPNLATVFLLFFFSLRLRIVCLVLFFCCTAAEQSPRAVLCNYCA